MDKRERENVAANAVVEFLYAQLGLSVTASLWDDGSTQGMHDFYLDGDGHRMALEVSTIADGNRVGRDIRWDSKVPEQLISIGGLDGAWLATVETEAEADDVVPVVTTHVPALASLGFTRVDTRKWQNYWFTPPESRPPEFEPLLALSKVGVSDVSKIENPSADTLRDFGGKVQVLRTHGHTRPAERNFPVTFLNNQLSDPQLHASDVAKLETAEATARHLWLWVEWHEGSSILRSFEVEGLPSDDIDCTALDGLWLGCGASNEQVAVVCWLRDQGWHRHNAKMSFAD